MGLTKLGFDSYLQFGREITWGTGVAATHRIPATSIRMPVAEGRIESNVLDGGPLVKTIYQGASLAVCEVEFDMHYNGISLLLDTLMGTASFGSNGGTSGAGPPYTHSWATQKAIHNSLTLQRSVGGGATGDQLTGCKIQEFVISGQAEGDNPLTGKITFLGKTRTLGVTLTTPLAQVTPVPIFPSYLNTTNALDGITAAAADRKVTSFELTVRNGLFDGMHLGSRWRAEPERVARPEVTYKFTTRFVTTELLGAWQGNTSGAISFSAYRDANYNFIFTIANAKLIEYDDPIPVPGGIEVTGTWKAIDPASDGTGFTMTMVNTQALITT